jgi:uncharacterized membrane protein
MSKIHQRFLASLQSFLRVALIGSLVFGMVLNSGAAIAARSGGRMGGSSFRSRPMPSRTYSSPNRSYGSPSYPGGGFGFPFLIPFFGFGGGAGGLFSILILIAVANFLVSSFRRAKQNGDGDLEYSSGYANPSVTLNTLHVGLLAEARDLQPELDNIARGAETGTPEGLCQMLQETTLALSRHPEYWKYAGVESQETGMNAAESQFNRLTLAERSKLSAETLSNVNRQLKAAPTPALLPGETTSTLVSEGPGEYIVVTLVVASEGKISLPKLNSAQDLRQSLNQLGGVASDRLLAVEVLWQPQSVGDTLTSEELVAAYPNLKLI